MTVWTDKDEDMAKVDLKELEGAMNKLLDELFLSMFEYYDIKRKETLYY